MICPHLRPAAQPCPDCAKIQAILSLEMTRIEKAAADEAMSGGLDDPEERAEHARTVIQLARMRITLAVLNALLEVAQLSVRDRLIDFGGEVGE